MDDFPQTSLLERYTFRGYLHNNVALFSDQYGKLYAVKKIPFDSKIIENEKNHYFKREVSLSIEAQNTKLPFVPFISSFDPVPGQDGLIITKFMEGGSLMHQINIQNENTQDVETKNYTLAEYTSSDSPFQLDEQPISASSSYVFPIMNFKYNNSIKMINIYGVALAVRYLHKLNILHRDIKPENILLDEHCHPYLSDFGYARKVFETQQMSGLKGTAPYIAPEMQITNSASLQADIFSFGVTMIMILKGKLEIQYNNQIVNAYSLKDMNQLKLLSLLRNGSKYIIPTETIDNTGEKTIIPQNLYDLIDKCIDSDPAKRPKIEQVIEVLESPPVLSFGGDEYRKYYESFQ